MNAIADALPPSLSFALQALGALSAGCFLLSLSTTLLKALILPGISLKRFGANKDSWAIVTGASDGIGREFAIQLAKSGFNVFLAARNPEKLASVESEIQSKVGSSVHTKSYTIDFAHADEAKWDDFAATIESLNIGVLVNNVGKSHEMPVDFVETPADEINDILSLNINATLRVTSAIAPGMVLRRRGLILNLGSFAGAAPAPMLATYSASKAFLATWSDALAAELGPQGVVVEHSNTYFVVSSMSKIRRASMMVPTPATYVRAVLKSIAPGNQTPYWSHKLLSYVMGLAPASVVMWYTHNLHKNIRKRALRKKEREAKKA